ncbi:MAG TPA: hypothetical protein VFN66_02190 [Burkholderiales bacterium]|nr:hypothetical protein [Burkholderiales bacterium]
MPQLFLAARVKVRKGQKALRQVDHAGRLPVKARIWTALIEILETGSDI